MLNNQIDLHSFLNLIVVNKMARWKEEMMMITLLLMMISSMGTDAKEMQRWHSGSRINRRRHSSTSSSSSSGVSDDVNAYCLSWRMAVEANNMRGWPTIPTQCLPHVQDYMLAGQYFLDINFVIAQVYAYLHSLHLNNHLNPNNALDAWIFDVDDTCLSNLFYYRAKHFGCDPYNPTDFKTWALRGESPAIPAVLELYNKVVEAGYQVILLTGRDEDSLGDATVDNLLSQGFVGYQRLILRSGKYRGQSAMTYKSEVRRQLIEQGYRIWGNIGDQWSDLQGNFTGDRTFKLPNPMYFVP